MPMLLKCDHVRDREGVGIRRKLACEVRDVESQTNVQDLRRFSRVETSGWWALEKRTGFHEGPPREVT